MGPMVQRQPATASGVALYICHRCSPHVADTQVGEIRGYAQLQPLPGWRECPPSVIVSAFGAVAASSRRCAAYAAPAAIEPIGLIGIDDGGGEQRAVIGPIGIDGGGGRWGQG